MLERVDPNDRIIAIDPDGPRVFKLELPLSPSTNLFILLQGIIPGREEFKRLRDYIDVIEMSLVPAGEAETK